MERHIYKKKEWKYLINVSWRWQYSSVSTSYISTFGASSTFFSFFHSVHPKKKNNNIETKILTNYKINAFDKNRFNVSPVGRVHHCPIHTLIHAVNVCHAIFSLSKLFFFSFILIYDEQNSVTRKKQTQISSVPIATRITFYKHKILCCFFFHSFYTYILNIFQEMELEIGIESWGHKSAYKNTFHCFIHSH